MGKASKVDINDGRRRKNEGKSHGRNILRNRSSAVWDGNLEFGYVAEASLREARGIIALRDAPVQGKTFKPIVTSCNNCGLQDVNTKKIKC